MEKQSTIQLPRFCVLLPAILYLVGSQMAEKVKSCMTGIKGFFFLLHVVIPTGYNGILLEQTPQEMKELCKNEVAL